MGVKFDNILDNGNQNQNQPFSLTEYENTLDYLPENQSIHGSKELEYKILSGPKKDEKGCLDSFNTKIPTSQGELEIKFEQNNFYLPPNTQVLLKTANQVLTGHLSDKYLLEKDMKIVLQ